MFEINKNRAFFSDIPVITDNLEVLHFDEFPILFMGTNIYGNKIIGSLLYEDVDTDTFRYLHMQITNKVLNDFINKKISYREVVSISKAIFIIDKNINNEILSTYYLPYNEISKEYLPLESSFCPDMKLKLGLDFGIRLTGDLADAHEASIKSAYLVANSLAELIERAISSLVLLKYKSQINLIPSTTGSFKINLIVKIPNFQKKIQFISQLEISEYISKYINYCIEDLPNEVEHLTDKIPLNEKKFEELSLCAENIYAKSALKYNDVHKEKLKIKVIDSLAKVEILADEIGNGFKEIEIFGNTQDTNSEIQIAHIDKEQKEKIFEASEYMILNSDETITDDEDKGYSICIFHLNLKTRVGNAYIFSDEQKKVMDTPKIMILGDDELTGTEFTESLHLNKWIDIKGKAQKYKGKFKRITIKSGFKD
jgi:hypothetical protein